MISGSEADDRYFDYVVSFMATQMGIDNYLDLSEEEKSKLYWDFQDSEEFQMLARVI